MRENYMIPNFKNLETRLALFYILANLVNDWLNRGQPDSCYLLQQSVVVCYLG